MHAGGGTVSGGDVAHGRGLALNAKMKELIDTLAPVLPEAVVAHIRSLVDANESPVALEELCGYVSETDHTLSILQWTLIRQLGAEFAVDPSWWEPLRHA